MKGLIGDSETKVNTLVSTAEQPICTIQTQLHNRENSELTVTVLSLCTVHRKLERKKKFLSYEALRKPD